MQPRNPRPILAELENPAAYASELALLSRRHAHVGRRPWQQAGLELADLGPRSQALIAKELARSVPRGEYRFAPSVARVSQVGGKERVLYRANITDTAVIGVVAKALRRLSEPLVSSRVYSYRPKRSSLEAVRDFASFVRAHRSGIADPRSRGLHVLRRDVTRYGESIPVDDESPLWPILSEVFAHWGIPAESPFAVLTRASVRPLIESERGPQNLDRGVPTGSAIQPVICNLYLGELDRSFAHIQGGFYARFGDDILFAHADAHAFSEAEQTADALVSALGLSFKAEKSKNLYFNAAGRSFGANRGSAFVEYLGLRLHFSGAIGLPTAKARRLLREITRRIDNAMRINEPRIDNALHTDKVPRIANEHDAARLELLCGAAARSLDPKSSLSQVMVPLLAHAVDARDQLAHLDYLIALRIAERLAQRRGVKAFRKVSYRSLRRAGLPSLLAARNARHARNAHHAHTPTTDRPARNTR